jgi:hypothetical protein
MNNVIQKFERKKKKQSTLLEVDQSELPAKKRKLIPEKVKKDENPGFITKIGSMFSILCSGSERQKE